MSLTFDQRNDKIAILFDSCFGIMSDKGPSYAGTSIDGTGEANDNFYAIAHDLKLPPREVWSVYFLKHSRSLFSYLTQGKETSEGVQGNIKDMINYLAILSTMIEDNWGAGKVEPLMEPPVKVTPVEIVTISQQRAIYFNRVGNMDDFTPNLELAQVSTKAYEVNR